MPGVMHNIVGSRILRGSYRLKEIVQNGFLGEHHIVTQDFLFLCFYAHIMFFFLNNLKILNPKKARGREM